MSEAPPTDAYWTLAAPAEAFLKEKGSKFLAYAFPVQDKEDVKVRLEELRKVHYDAHHHCYAYRLGVAGEEFRAHDDGEPHHSAGDPILGQIRSFNLSHVLVVVVRYFGGTKLGVGGLITAYKEAARMVLAEATLEERLVKTHFHVHFDYPLMNEAMQLVKSLEPEVVNQDFGLSCTLHLAIRKSREEELLQAFQDIHGIRVQTDSLE
ncbi:MAG: IMPACT family protein [Nitritalea sp.]